MIMKITPFHRTVYIKTMIVIYYLQGFSGRSDGKEFICNVGDLGSIPGLGRFPGEENGNSLQYSGLKNSTDRGASQATIHRVTKSRTRLSNFYSLIHYWASLVAQRYRVWMQCRRLRRCGFYPWVRKIPWRRAWQSTPVFLPGESSGKMSLTGYGPWCDKESDMTGVTEHKHSTMVLLIVIICIMQTWMFSPFHFNALWICISLINIWNDYILYTFLKINCMGILNWREITKEHLGKRSSNLVLCLDKDWQIPNMSGVGMCLCVLMCIYNIQF